MSLSMSGEKEYLDAALNGLLTAIFRLEVGVWYAGWKAAERGRVEGGAERGEPQSIPASPSSKGKDKVATLTERTFLLTPFLSLPCLANLVVSYYMSSRRQWFESPT
jgi:hypothetical protein